MVLLIGRVRDLSRPTCRRGAPDERQRDNDDADNAEGRGREQKAWWTIQTGARGPCGGVTYREHGRGWDWVEMCAKHYAPLVDAVMQATREAFAELKQGQRLLLAAGRARASVSVTGWRNASMIIASIRLIRSGGAPALSA
jgi:hypothetical protein